MKLVAHSLRLIVLLSLSALAYATEPSPTLDKHRVDPNNLQEGDLVFIRSHSRNAKAIADVTQSNFTHCGIVFKENGTWRVREGAGMHTKYADLNEWQDKESTDFQTKKIDKYEPITVRRLKEMKNWSKEQRAENIQKLRNEAQKLHETYYDFGFAWNNHYTVKNGTDQFSKNADDKEYVYCSELIYKAFARALTLTLGDLKKLGDYPLNQDAKGILNNPRGIKSRGDKKYSLDETVISPQGISDSNLLESVNVETH